MILASFIDRIKQNSTAKFPNEGISFLFNQLPRRLHVALFSKRGPHSKSQQIDSTHNSVGDVDSPARVNRVKQFPIQLIHRVNSARRVQSEAHQWEPPRQDDLEPGIVVDEGFEGLRHPNVGPDVGLEVRHAVAPQHEP